MIINSRILVCYQYKMPAQRNPDQAKVGGKIRIFITRRPHHSNYFQRGSHFALQSSIFPFSLDKLPPFLLSSSLPPSRPHPNPKLLKPQGPPGWASDAVTTNKARNKKHVPLFRGFHIGPPDELGIFWQSVHSELLSVSPSREKHSSDARPCCSRGGVWGRGRRWYAT